MISDFSQTSSDDARLLSSLVAPLLGVTATHSRLSADRPSCATCSIVHCDGSLSGRQRWNDVPCRNRPPEKWSYCTSTTSFGANGSHCAERSVLHRLGPPGAWPVNPGFLISFSSFGVSFSRSAAFMFEQNPTWLSKPSSS